MDNRQVITWIVGIVTRGIVWILAAKLGYTAAAAESLAGEIGSALGALALAGASVWHSVRERRKLLDTQPLGK